MTDLDVVLRWGPYALALAGAALGMLVVVAHIGLARLAVAFRNRRSRRSLTPVHVLGESPPDGVVCIEGALVLPARHTLHDRDDTPPEDERAVIVSSKHRVRLDGPVRVTAGTVDIIQPRPAARRIMRGVRVRARGRLRLAPTLEGESYRGESAAWCLVPESGAIDVAAMTTKRIRGHRWGLSTVLALVASTVPAALASWAGARAFAAVGAPGVELVAIEGDTARWRRVWSVRDREHLALAALSPLLRGKVRAQRARESSLLTAFPPLSSEEHDRLAAVLRDNGDCLHEVTLALRTGQHTTATALASTCADVAVRRLLTEARCLSSPGDLRGCALAALRRGASSERWEAALTAGASRREATGGHGMRADDPGPVEASAKPTECAMVTAIRDPGAGVAPLPAASWDDLLAHPDPRCRLLGATRPARRDAESLGALMDPTRPAGGALLSHARAFVSLVGADAGRITGPVCAERPAPADLDPGFLSTNPTVALAFMRAGIESPCPWVGDRIYLAAAQGFSRFMSEAGTDAVDAACGAGRCDGLADARGWSWAIDAIRVQRTLHRFGDTALRRIDRRYAPRRRSEQEAAEVRALQGLPMYVSPLLDQALARDGNWTGDFSWAAVVRTMAGVRVPSAWPHREWAERRGLHAHQVDREAVWSSALASSQERAPRFAALVDYWRTGTWAPSRDAPALYRSARMRRAVDAAAGMNTEDVLRVIGPPDEEGVEILAAVAPRLTGRRPSATFWLRASLGYRLPSSRPAPAQVHHLARVVSAARRLRLAALSGEVEELRARALDALLSQDPWVTAVLDEARRTP